jgi:hypothetical protein
VDNIIWVVVPVVNPEANANDLDHVPVGIVVRLPIIMFTYKALLACL